MPANKIRVGESEHDSQLGDVQLNLELRAPTIDEAYAIWKLVCDTDVLDSNSPYCYLLLCRDFAETCLVGVVDEQIIAFVSAYRPPTRTNTLFVWQIAVAAGCRRNGIGSKLLRALTRLHAVQDCMFIEATVTPGNRPSLRMFERLAEYLRVPIESADGFGAELFFSGGNKGADRHEEERLIRIGPLGRKAPFLAKHGPETLKK